MLQPLYTSFKKHRTLICSIVFLVLYSVSISSAAPLYTTNNTTLDPQCIPGDADCTVSQLPSQWTTGTGAISYNGNVGIGTTNPSALLDLAGINTATSGAATTQNIAGTLIASADNDTLTGLKIVPTFTNGSFTGVKNYNIWSQGTGKNIFGSDSNIATDGVGTYSYINQSRYSLSGTENIIPTVFFTEYNPTTTADTSLNSQQSVSFSMVKNGDVRAQTITNVASFVRNAGNGNIGTVFGSYSTFNHAGAGTVTSSHGYIGQIQNTGTGVLTNTYGLTGSVYQSGSGSMTSPLGVWGQTYTVAGASGTITNARGVLGQVSTDAASSTSISNAFVLSSALAHAGSGTITTSIGLRVLAPTGSGPITTNYGIRLFSQMRTGITTSYGISQEGTADLNTFAGYVAIGADNRNAAFSIQANRSFPAWGTNGVQASFLAATYTDSSSSASSTVTNNMVNSFGIPTLAATNTAVTYTNAATLYIAGAPVAGTNTTITNPYALNIAGGNAYFGGNIGSGIAPTTRLHIGNLPAVSNYLSVIIEGNSGHDHGIMLVRGANPTQGLLIARGVSAVNTSYTGASFIRSAGGVDQDLNLQSGQSTATVPVRGALYTQTGGGNFVIGSHLSNSLFSVNLSQVGNYGNVSTTSGSGTVTGTGTTFLTTFKVGDTIKIGSETRTINAIASNASMTTDTWSTTNTNQLFTVNALTGTASTTIGSPTVTGTGTNFTKVFVPGSKIFLSQYAETYDVLSVQSDTSLTLVENSFNTTNGSYSVSGNALIRFTVNGNGNVGIGNGLSAYLLTVGSSAVPTGTTVTRFQNAGGTCDVVPSTSGGITCSSDYNLKKNITTLSNTPWAYQTSTTDSESLSILNKVLALQPVQYNWNVESDTDTKHAGFIAQDVQQLFPDLVSTDSATGLLSLNYTGLLPYTIQALQDITITITTLADTTKTNSLRDSLIAWLGSAGNGIGDLFANKVTGKQLCVDDLCITKEQLQVILQNNNISTQTPQVTPTTTTTTTTPEPATEEVPPAEQPATEEAPQEESVAADTTEENTAQ